MKLILEKPTVEGKETPSEEGAVLLSLVAKSKDGDVVSCGSQNSASEEDGAAGDNAPFIRDNAEKSPEVEHGATEEKAEHEEEERDEDVSSESYPASSHYTENTDSVTGGFSLTNRARRFGFLNTYVNLWVIYPHQLFLTYFLFETG